MRTLTALLALLTLQGCAAYFELLREAHTPDQEARSRQYRADHRATKIDRLLREHERSKRK